MNAYGGGHSFFRQSIGGSWSSFFSNLNPKSADLIPDAYKCVFGKGGVAIFLTLMGREVMQFYNLGIGGGQHFFSYSEALSATTTPLHWNLWTVPLAIRHLEIMYHHILIYCMVTRILQKHLIITSLKWGSPSASDPRAKNTGQRATKGTVLTSQSLSTWCNCRRLGSTWGTWRWQDINVGNPLWWRALLLEPI